MVLILLVTVFFYGNREPEVIAVRAPEACMEIGKGVKADLEKRPEVRDVEYACIGVTEGNKG